MFDLKKMLEEDEMYKKILNASTPEERKILEEYMENFLAAWQNGFFTPLEKKITEDDKFREELRKKMLDG